MVHEQLKDEALKGKYVICYPYGTHGAIDVWEEEYGSFDTQAEAEFFLDEKRTVDHFVKLAVKIGKLYVRETAIPWYPYRKVH